MVTLHRRTMRVGETLKINDLLAPELKGVIPYVLGDLQQQASTELTKLDLNENLCVDDNLLAYVIKTALAQVDPKQYPEPQAAVAVRAISRHFAIDQSRIYVGNGSDDILERISRCFAKKDSTVLIVEPTFFMYKYFAGLSGARTKSVLLKTSFDLDVDAIIRTMDASTSILLLCSPNNPTANQFKRENLTRILEEFSGLVVVDEAYADFGRYSTARWTDKYEQLVVIRSFSKSHGLAALRAGYAISNPSVIEWLNRATPPFNVNAVTQKLIEIALNKSPQFKKQIQLVLKERDWFMKQLEAIKEVKPYPSDANFILFKILGGDSTSHQVWRKLKEMKILVRDKGQDPLLENCIRVAVGTREMNLRFLKSLRLLLHK